MEAIDFKVKNTGRELYIYPVSELGRKICKLYKGVYMKCLIETYGNYDHFIGSYSRLLNTPITCELI